MPDVIETTVRRLIETGIGGGDMAVIDELVAPDCIEHQRGHPQGAAGVRELSERLHRWFTDPELRVEAWAVVDDRVWLRSRLSGISTGAVLGLAPTGRPVEVDVFDVVRVADGRIVEHWGVADQMGLLLQLGFEPAAAAPVGTPS